VKVTIQLTCVSHPHPHSGAGCLAGRPLQAQPQAIVAHFGYRLECKME
jgi:hypothetical protein